MGRAALCMRAAALLAAAGMFIFLAEGISADDDIAEAVAARVLEPTELVAEIPEEFGTLFQIQWGGGSLFQLAGRLAARGCAMNTLWVHDGGQWHPYNRYNVPRDAALIQEFIRRYERDLPAGTFYATCADQPVPQNLQPTQIVAEIPEEYDTLFDLQWGGGSFLHLKGRLATMGCMANNISFTDPETNTEYTYNQYTTRSTDPTNQQFLTEYEQFIPANTLTADCYNVCEFGGERCLSFDELREQKNVELTQQLTRLRQNKEIVCTDDFHPLVKEKVLPILPIRPDTCIVRAENKNRSAIRGVAFTSFNNGVPVIIVSDARSGAYRSNTTEHSDILLSVEIHELCHINQQWHWAQHLALDKSVDFSYNKRWMYLHDSVHGKEFIEIVDYRYNAQHLPVDSPYRDIYSPNPTELSAELCAMYLIGKIGATQSYNYDKWDSYRGSFVEVPIRDFDTSKYLTPEVVEWLENYMMLPDVSE